MKTIERFSYQKLQVNRWVLICTAGAILFSLYLHLIAAGSPLQFDDETWLENFYLHKNAYPYNIRYFQTYSTILLNKISGLTLQDSFYVIQYLLSGLIALLFYNFLNKLQISRNWSVFAVALFLLTFPMAAAHFEPVHTWDDFWMYGFSILSFSALYSRKWLLSSVFFTLGCFAREQMLLFYPILLVEAWGFRKEADFRKIIFSLLLPLVIYGSFYMITYEPSDPKRWSLITYNFANSARAADVTISVWNSFGFLWMPAIIGFVKVWNQKLAYPHGFCLKGAVISVPITLFLGVFFTLVRETRILFPPFVFVIPLVAYTIRDDWPGLPKTRFRFFWPSLLIVAAILIFLGIQLANVLWPEFDYGSSAKLRRDFAGVNIGLSFIYLIFLIQSRLHKRKYQSAKE